MIDHEFPDRTGYREWLVDSGFRNNFIEAPAKEHVSCPCVWLSKTEKDGDPDPSDIDKYLGGHDACLNWCRDLMKPCEEVTTPLADMVPDGYTPDHGYVHY